jgi:hypothetical protein
MPLLLRLVLAVHGGWFSPRLRAAQQVAGVHVPAGRQLQDVVRPEVAETAFDLSDHGPVNPGLGAELLDAQPALLAGSADPRAELHGGNGDRSGCAMHAKRS